MPKFNLYQSLHTTVVGPEGSAVEFQIRTSEMHRRAEYGVAAHWGYKEHRNPTEDLVWLQRIVDWQQDTTDPGEFMQSLKIDLEQDEVFVFTPKGRVITLPTGATPVDFAYAIHTEVGHRCIGARVNGRLVPLDSALHSGETCEIFTSKVEGAGPSRDWLQFVHTPPRPLQDPAVVLARAPGRRDRRRAATSSSRPCATRACRCRSWRRRRRCRRSPPSSTTPISTRSTPRSARGTCRPRPSCSASSATCAAARSSCRSRLPARRGAPGRGHGDVGVHVEGLDDVMVRLSRCCTPGPRRRDHGFRHPRPRCVRAPHRLRERAEPADAERPCDRRRVGQRRARATTSCRSRSKRSTARACCVTSPTSSRNTTSTSSPCSSQTQADRIARLRFEFELADPGHLHSILLACEAGRLCLRGDPGAARRPYR